LYDLQQSYILEECKQQGVDIPGNLVPTNPNHAVAIAVRDEIRRTISDIDRIKSIALNQRNIDIIKAKPWLEIVPPRLPKVPGLPTELNWLPYAVGAGLGLYVIYKVMK